LAKNLRGVAFAIAKVYGEAAAIEFMKACGLNLAAERARIAEVRARRERAS
jgi:hypothetical protein